MCIINCQSARNKAGLILDYIRDHDCDIVALTETWFRSGNLDQKAKGDITPSGYKLRCVSRVGKRGGGVAILFKETLTISENVDLSRPSLEALGVTVTHDATTIRLIVLYRPPKAPRGTDFFSDFAEIIDQYSLMSGQLLIVGDYNIHWDRVETPTTKRLVDLLDSTNLVQHVSEPTHRDGHIIDLVVTRQDDSIVQATSVLSMLSDHMAIHVHLNVSKPPRPTKTISFRKIRSIDQDCLADNILGSEIITHPATELDGMVHQYNTTLRALLDKHAPLKTKTFPVRQMIPWYSDEIEDAKQQRRKLERLWRRTRLTVHRQMYQAQKQLLNDLIKSEKARYYNDKITNSAGNQSTLFKTVDQLLHRKAVQSLPAHSSVQELADRFSNYFTSKIETIRQALDTNVQETTDHHLMNVG